MCKTKARPREESKSEMGSGKNSVGKEGLKCEIDFLRHEIEKFEEKEEKHSKNQDILSKLYDQGVIDSDGNLK